MKQIKYLTRLECWKIGFQNVQNPEPLPYVYLCLCISAASLNGLVQYPVCPTTRRFDFRSEYQDDSGRRRQPVKGYTERKERNGCSDKWLFGCCWLQLTGGSQLGNICLALIISSLLISAAVRCWNQWGCCFVVHCLYFLLLYVEACTPLSLSLDWAARNLSRHAQMAYGRQSSSTTTSPEVYGSGVDAGWFRAI